MVDRRERLKILRFSVLEAIRRTLAIGGYEDAVAFGATMTDQSLAEFIQLAKDETANLFGRDKITEIETRYIVALTKCAFGRGNLPQMQDYIGARRSN